MPTKCDLVVLLLFHDDSVTSPRCCSSGRCLPSTTGPSPLYKQFSDPTPEPQGLPFLLPTKTYWNTSSRDFMKGFVLSSLNLKNNLTIYKNFHSSQLFELYLLIVTETSPRLRNFELQEVSFHDLSSNLLSLTEILQTVPHPQHRSGT